MEIHTLFLTAAQVSHVLFVFRLGSFMTFMTNKTLILISTRSVAVELKIISVPGRF